MQTVTRRSTKRNEGGRYSAKHGSDWYRAIEAANIQAVEDQERALVTALATQVGNAAWALPEAATRITKAATLVQKREIWPLTSGSFLVGSQSDGQAAHLVTRGPWHCDCHHMQYRDSLCSHALAAMLTVKMGATYQATYTLPEAG